MPVVVKGLSGSAVAISGGENDTCALISGGAVECWQSTPVAVSGLQHDVVAISDSGLQTCALLRGGAVKCWGINDHGQLGNGTTKDSWTPVAVTGLQHGVVAISVGNADGDHACALLRDGTVRCWGENEFGQLGDGTTQQRATPVKVQGLRDVAAVVVNSYDTYALLRGGTVEYVSKTALKVSGLQDNVIAISAGVGHECALMRDRTVRCWGNNDEGQLGNGADLNAFREIPGSNTPITVTGLHGVLAITSGRSHSCALLHGGRVKCWGDNGSGELGNGTKQRSSIPITVKGL